MSHEENNQDNQETKNFKRKRVILDEQTKLEILERLENGEKQIVLATEYGVGRSTISDLKIRKYGQVQQKPKKVVLDLQQKLRLLERLENGEKEIELAAEYGINESTISDLKAKKDNQEQKNSKRRRVCLDLQKKLRILDRLQNGEKQAVLAAEYGVGKSTISDLKASKDKLLEYTSQCEDVQLQRSTMRVCSDLDQRLYRWVLEERLKNGSFPTGPDLHKEALSLHQQMFPGDSSFRASNGWLHRFRLRHGLHRNLSDDDIAKTLQAKIEACLSEDAIKTESEDPDLYSTDLEDCSGDKNYVEEGNVKTSTEEEPLLNIVPKTEVTECSTSSNPDNPYTIVGSLKDTASDVHCKLAKDILGSEMAISFSSSLTSNNNEYNDKSKTNNISITEIPIKVGSSNIEILNIKPSNETTVSSSIESELQQTTEQSSSTRRNNDFTNVLNIPKATDILEMCGKIRLFLLTKTIQNKNVAMESVSKLESVIAEALCVHGDI